MGHREVMKKLLENFSDEEIMSLLRSDLFHRDLACKWASGTDFLFGGEKIEKLTFTSSREVYTEIQPKIKIGDVEVNAPYLVKPEIDSEYWMIEFYAVGQCRWKGDVFDASVFNFGNCFKTKSDAQAARDAISKLLKGE